MAHANSIHQDLQALYSDHHGWLVSWLRRRLGNGADAADLAQDAFVRLLLKPLAFDSFDGARAYLSVMARSMCVDLWRRREIEAAWLEALADQPPAVAPSAEHCMLVLEALYEVDAMLRRLPPKAAQAFLLSQVHGLTYREIAVEVGVSERMIKKYMAQAMLHCALLEAGIERE